MRIDAACDGFGRVGGSKKVMFVTFCAAENCVAKSVGFAFEICTPDPDFQFRCHFGVFRMNRFGGILRAEKFPF